MLRGKHYDWKQLSNIYQNLHGGRGCGARSSCCCPGPALRHLWLETSAAAHKSRLYSGARRCAGRSGGRAGRCAHPAGRGCETRISGSFLLLSPPPSLTKVCSSQNSSLISCSGMKHFFMTEPAIDVQGWWGGNCHQSVLGLTATQTIQRRNRSGGLHSWPIEIN